MYEEAGHYSIQIQMSPASDPICIPTVTKPPNNAYLRKWTTPESADENVMDDDSEAARNPVPTPGSNAAMHSLLN